MTLGQTHWLLIFINEILLKQTISTHLFTGYAVFLLAELSSCNKDHVEHSAKHIYCLTLYRKKNQRRQWHPTPVGFSCLENPMDGGAW